MGLVACGSSQIAVGAGVTWSDLRQALSQKDGWKLGLGLLLLWLTPVILYFACRDSYYYHSGRFREVRHHSFAAIDSYEKFLADRPADPRAAEVHVRAGRLYQDLHRCEEAHHHFETAAREFATVEPWASRARAGIMDCPDYFPIGSGMVWVYGDSASQGRNMRLEQEVRVSSGSGGLIQASLFAGNKRIRSDQAEYKKHDWQLFQLEDKEWVPILRYPFLKGESWRARRGKDTLEYTIEAADARVKTVAGTFADCLKVREFNRKFKGSWKYDYYAPFIGRVATSIAGPHFETPNTELIKFSP
jgi:tetratricopeptide (TPR) repeat protein